ncbi:unnamed protein product, partial [Brassica napus]
METDPAPPISSPADNSTAISASPSDIVCVPETTQFNTDSGFIGNITTSTSVSPTSSAPLVFAAAVETSAQFVYNSSLPSTPSSFSNLFVDNVVATSSDNFDMAQRSRGYGREKIGPKERGGTLTAPGERARDRRGQTQSLMFCF